MSVFKDLLPESLQRKGCPFLHHIDLEPDNSSAPGVLAGWAIENRSGLSVAVHVSGEQVLTVPALFPRHDVQSKFEGLQAPLFSGFEVRFPQELLERLPEGSVEVFAVRAGKPKKIWQCPGRRPGAGDRHALDQLKVELLELNRVPNDKPQLGEPTQSRVHIVVESSGLAAPLMKCLDQLDRILAAENLRPASVTVLNSGSKTNQDITRIAATTGLGRRSPLSTAEIGKSPSWESFQSDSESPVRDLVLFARDDVDLTFLSVAGLLQAYDALPRDGLVQPTPYGGQGASIPEGRGFADIAGSTKQANKSTRALAACENAGLVWLTSVKFLRQFDRRKHSISGHEFNWPLSRPPSGRFIYYLDLQQPVVYPAEIECFTSPYERWRVERALSDSLMLRNQAAAGPTIPIFLSPNWQTSRQNCGWQFQVLSLAKTLVDQGNRVVFVIASDSTQPFSIDGYPVYRFSEFVSNLESMTINWCITTTWDATHCANTLRRLCGASVCAFFQFAPHLCVSHEHPELTSSAYCSIHGLFTPLTTSRWLLEHLAAENSFLKDGVLIAPEVNTELFRSLPVERDGKSLVLVFTPHTSDGEIEFAANCIDELRALHATAKITAVILSERKARFKTIVDKADSCIFQPDSGQLAELFASNEIAAFLGTIAGFEPLALDAAACGAISVVTDKSTAQTIRPEAFPAVIAPYDASALARRIHELFWSADVSTQQKDKIARWIQQLKETERQSAVSTKLSKAEAQCLREFVQTDGKERPLSLLVVSGSSLDADLMSLRSALKHAPPTAPILLAAKDKKSEELSILESFCSQFSGRVKLVALGDSAGPFSLRAAGLKAIAADTDVLLIDSGTLIDSGLVDRLKKAAYSRPNIALASPISNNSENTKIEINIGDSHTSASKKIAQLSPRSRPNIPKPERCAIYIKRWALDRFGVFDDCYHGNSIELTDYGLRLALNGADTVCADDAFVFSSSSHTEQDPTSNGGVDLGRPLFDARWSKFFKALTDDFARRTPLADLRAEYDALVPSLVRPSEPFSLSKKQKLFLGNDRQASFLNPGSPVISNAPVVFLLPGVILGGGSISVIQHANEMVQRGIEARVISLGPVNVKDYTCLAPVVSTSLEQLFSLDWSNQAVVGTFWTTAYIIAALKRRHPALKAFYYVQDYEPWFYSHSEEFSRVKDARKSYELGLRCVAKTKFLAETVASEHDVDVDLVSPGLDHSIFYPGEQHLWRGRPRLAGMLRLATARRGGRETIELLRLLRSRLPELEMTMFGETSALPSDLSGFVKMAGELTPREVADSYRAADIVIDLSYWHGFGRTGIEGMACGAVPVLSSSGGISRYAQDGTNSFIIDGEDLDSAADRIIELAVDRDRRMRMRSAGLISSRKFSETLAVDDWLEMLGIEQTMRPEDDVFSTRNAQRPSTLSGHAQRAGAFPLKS